MAKSAGMMTEFETEDGRPIYITPEGELVSEKSTTINMDGKFINVPTIHDGIEYSEEEVYEMLRNKEIEPTSVHDTQEEAVSMASTRSEMLLKPETAQAVEESYPGAEMLREQEAQDQYQMSDTDKNIKEAEQRVVKDFRGQIQMAKGGSMEDQMKFFEEGGLYQEGGTTDPVSGNEVPKGSLKEEVRDDIDAKLSEGEFVFPADVVRYIGLENLMQLRQKAKEGLGKMDAMGQMGNAEEATMGDDGEYDAEIDSLIDEFDPNEDDSFEFAVGGAVPGVNLPSFNPQSYTTSQGFLPSYTQFMGGSSVPQYSSKQYIGPNGDIITITFVNNQPVQPIPEGYKLFTGQVVAPKVEVPEVKIKEDDKGGRDPEEVAEQERRYEQYKANAATLAAYDPKFAEKWAVDPAKTGKFTGLADMVIKSIDTAMSMTDSVEAVAKELGIDLTDYENKGLGRVFGGKYDVEAFTKNLNDMAEDLEAGRVMTEGEKEARASRAAQVREDFRAREEEEEAAFRADQEAKQKQADLDRQIQKEELGYDRESGSNWAGSDYDNDGQDDERGNEVSGFDDPTSDSYGELAKGGLLAPRTPRKPKTKQTTSTRGKGLARKK